MVKKSDEKTETEKSPFEIGDEVGFKLEDEDYEGFIDKAYNNSFLVTFESDDPEIIDKYHNKTIINYKDLTMIKAAPRIEKSEEDSEEEKDNK